MKRAMGAVSVAVFAVLLGGCSSTSTNTTTGASGASASTSKQTASSSPAPSTGAAAGSTWNGMITGSDQMKIGTDFAYAAEIHVVCSGSPSAPTATLETTEGWKATTTSPSSGFGESPVTITSPAGKSVALAESTKQGPIWNNGSFSMTFSREEQVGTETWKLWLGKVSCLGG